MLAEMKNKFTKKQRLLHKNIDFLVRKFKLDLKSLSAQCGIPMPTIVRMKKGDTNPTIDTLEPIAQFFRVDLNDLLYEDLSSDEYQSKKSVGNIQYIKTISLAEIQQWPIKFETKLFVGTVGNLNEGSFGIQIDTDFMAPIFYKNSIVIVDPAIKPKDGDYIFCLVEEDTIPVLRQYFLDGKNHFLKPINPNYGGIVGVKNILIIGVIVKSIESYR